MAANLIPRDRILMALAFQETDIVPYHLMIDEKVRTRLAGYFHDDEFDRKIINHLPFFNLEPKIRWISDTSYVDVFGCKWHPGIFPHLGESSLQKPSLQNYRISKGIG